MIKKLISVLCLLSFPFLLVGCASNASNTQYAASDLESAARTVEGTVVSKRPVQVAGSSSLGSVTGAAAGGIAGSSIGGSTRGHALGAIGGAILGGIAGSAIEKGVTKQNAFEYIVRVNKRLVTIIQSDANFNVGDHVFVIMSAKPRIIHGGR